MKNIICIFAILLLASFPGAIHAQTLSPKVLPTNGGSTVSGGITLSYTFGETFHTTLANGSTLLTQGEQQPEIDIATGIASLTQLCTGNSFLLPYTVTGKFGTGNQFAAQLSNAAGNFSSPVTIGFVSSSSGGTISCLIPAATPSGNNYRIRVVSNQPVFTGKESPSILSISNAPPAGTIHVVSAPTAGCVGNTDVVSVSAVPGAAFYNWVCSQSGILFNGNPSPYQSPTPVVTVSYTALPPAGASGWSICAFAGNACGNSNTICTWIRAVISAPSPISGQSTACAGTNGNSYATTAVPGAANYIWSGSGGMVIHGSGLNITVDFPPGFVSGTLCVHAQTSCGYNSPDRCITISTTAAVPGIISGSSYVCPGGTSLYNVTAVPGASTYNWTCSVPGAVLTPALNSCSILFPVNIPAGSYVGVASVSACGVASAMRSKGIASGLPNTPGNINGLATGQCGQLGVSYFINPVSLATGYYWTVSGGASISGPNNLNGVTVDFPSNFSTTTLSVRATNGCGMGNARNLIVQGAPAQPGLINGNISVCNGAFESYGIAGSIGASSYTWIVPIGANIIGTSTGPTVLVQWGSTGGNISVRAENNCGYSAQRLLGVSVTCRLTDDDSFAQFAPEVFPNPASDHFSIKFIADADVRIKICIYNSIGQLEYSKNLNAVAGINVSEINSASLAKGIYNLVISSERRSSHVKFVID